MQIVRAELVTSAAAREGFPRDGVPEIAFVGRSNVGKSSLLNKLAQRKALARTSGTPGKTRLVNFFRIERRGRAELLFVDLPGYGWARVAKRERAEWQRLIETYLAGRAALRGVLLLLDARRDPGDDERDFLPWLAARGVAVRLVVTKLDKLRASEREARLRAITRELGIPREALVLTSAQSGAGIDELWGAIDELVARVPNSSRPG
ncbi:MAG TPA: ribosome biogenesis GTP-binding protein YihA/YsxC [Myxococcota bacterium]|nr:ribosome biogenesis GTP-binding protein YihA/YsxC [Myxococcota bacterium]